MKGTIKSSTEISEIFKEGQRFKAKGMLILIKESDVTRDQSTGRVAFIAGKKIGCAPKRNRAKRILRSIAFELGAPWYGKDVIFVATSNLLSTEYSLVLKSCRDCLSAAIKDI